MSTARSSAHEAAIRSFLKNPTVLRLHPGVQHYAWGSTDFIPELLGAHNPNEAPYAELWMGAHPALPASVVVDGVEIPLDKLIERAADQVLGPEVAQRFGGKLPYLFKVLSAACPLSIQAHPTKTRAEEGFSRENAAAVPIDAAGRNYKDDNHKPEILAALTDFYALRGFRPLEEIGQVLAEVPELRQVMPDYRPTPECLKRLYERLMTLAHADVDSILEPLVLRLAAAASEKPFSPDEWEYWVLQADREFSHDGHRDRGLFSIYLLNLVHLEPGEAVYLPAGILHAYLRGSGMELMANSNNVLRGGLTRKHVDVPELLTNVVFEGGPAEVIMPDTADRVESVYRTSASEFELHRIDVSPDQSFRSGAVENADIVIVIDADKSAQVTIRSASAALQMSKGNVVLVPHGVEFDVNSSAPATLFRATIPAAKSSSNTPA